MLEAPSTIEDLPAERTTPPAEASSTRFLPIVSLRTGRCWAVEAGAGADGLAAVDRFARGARVADLGLALHRHARDVAELAMELPRLAALADALGVPRGSLTVQVTEHDAGELEALAAFTRACKREGFLVAVAHVGTGHPSAERIVRLEPDVLTIDATIVRGVASERAARQACRAILELARGIGALVVAEGVETAEDLVELAMLGIDLFQGPLIAEAAPDVVQVSAEAEARVAELRARLRARAEAELARRRAERQIHERVFVAVVTRLAHCRVSELDGVAEQAVRQIEGLEALYVLDHRGMQLTETWLQPGLTPRSGFRPARRGTDLGLKDYFLEVAHGAAAYVSRPYVSMASGRLSVTHSRRVRLADGSTIVVCCDVPSAET